MALFSDWSDSPSPYPSFAPGRASEAARRPIDAQEVSDKKRNDPYLLLELSN